MVDFADVDTLAAGYHQRGGQPGLAYGIVIGGERLPALARRLVRGGVRRLLYMAEVAP